MKAFIQPLIVLTLGLAAVSHSAYSRDLDRQTAKTAIETEYSRRPVILISGPSYFRGLSLRLWQAGSATTATAPFMTKIERYGDEQSPFKIIALTSSAPIAITVTGITGSEHPRAGHIREVQFDYLIGKSNAFATLFALPKGSGTATFMKFDDGWRFQRMYFNPDARFQAVPSTEGVALLAKLKAPAIEETLQEAQQFRDPTAPAPTVIRDVYATYNEAGNYLKAGVSDTGLHLRNDRLGKPSYHTIHFATVESIAREERCESPLTLCAVLVLSTPTGRHRKVIGFAHGDNDHLASFLSVFSQSLKGYRQKQGVQLTTTEPPQAAAPSYGRLVQAQENNGDAVQLISITPPPGTPLNAGKDTLLTFRLAYTLKSAESARLAISIAQFGVESAGCGGRGNYVDANEARVLAGHGEVTIQVLWHGGVSRGTPPDRGYIAPAPSFWHASKHERLSVIGAIHEACFPFAR